MLRKIIFRDTKTGSELVLPVTPAEFQVTAGMKIETINIHTLGDVNLAGYTTLMSVSMECLFPRAKRSYTNGALLDPDSYIDTIKRWINEQTVLRYIVSDTKINVPVLVESVSYGERDGTNDIYASVSLREYRGLAVVKTESITGNSGRTTEAAPVTSETYTIKRGDTLSGICRKFYGDSSLYPKVAAYNGIKNPNLIYTGNTLKLPPKSQL